MAKKSKHVDLVIEHLPNSTHNNPTMRVRRSTWPPDWFEIISWPDWVHFSAVCEQLGITLKDLRDEED